MFARERKRSLPRVWRCALTVGVIVLVALAAAALVEVDPNALCLLPMLALALVLWLRRYPGERIIAALSHKDEARASRPVPRPRLAPVPSIVRGGLLLACSLAVRPPPAPPVAVLG